MQFSSISDLNLYLDKKEELSEQEFIFLVEKNENLIDGESMQDVKTNYEQTNFKNFGYFFGEFLEHFEGCFFY